MRFFNKALIIFFVVLIIFGCRPKTRSVFNLFARPMLTVMMIGMNEEKQSEYKFRLAGCADVDGVLYPDTQRVTFEDRTIKVGLTGCRVEVSHEKRIKDVEFLDKQAGNGIFWRSEEFSIKRNENDGLVASTKMQKLYREKDIKDGQHFNLEVPIALEKKSDLSLLAFSATLQCANIEEMSVADVIVKSDYTANLFFLNQKMPQKNEPITCQKVKVVGALAGKKMVFEGILTVDHVFQPVAGQTLKLNTGEGRYALHLVSSDFGVTVQATENQIQTTILGRCPESKPFLNPKTYECTPCPDDKPDFHPDRNECLAEILQ